MPNFTHDEPSVYPVGSPQSYAPTVGRPASGSTRVAHEEYETYPFGAYCVGTGNLTKDTVRIDTDAAVEIPELIVDSTNKKVLYAIVPSVYKKIDVFFYNKEDVILHVLRDVTATMTKGRSGRLCYRTLPMSMQKLWPDVCRIVTLSGDKVIRRLLIVHPPKEASADMSKEYVVKVY